MTTSIASSARSERMRGKRNRASENPRTKLVRVSQQFLDMLRDELGYASFAVFERATLDKRAFDAFDEWTQETWSDRYPRVFVTREGDPFGAVWIQKTAMTCGFIAVWRNEAGIHSDASDKLHDTAADAFARAMELRQ